MIFSKPQPRPPRQRSALRQELSKHASSFMLQCGGSEVRMKGLVAELHGVADAARHVRPGYKRVLIRGLILAALLSFLAVRCANVMNGWSFMFFGMGAAFAILYALILMLKEKLEERKLVKSMQQLSRSFQETIGPLEASLEALKTTCGNLRKISTEELTIINLEMDILEVFLISSKAVAAAAAGAILEAARESGRALDQFLQMNRELEMFHIPSRS